MREQPIDILDWKIRRNFGDAIYQFENLRIRFVGQTGDLIALFGVGGNTISIHSRNAVFANVASGNNFR